MKLLYLLTEDWFFWLHRRSLATAAREAGFEVVVATAPGSHREEIEAAGFRFRPLILRRRVGNPLRNGAALAQLVALYRKERPDLVHHVSLLPVLAGSTAARLARRPAVVNDVTGLGHWFTPGGLKRRTMRAFLERTSRFACRRKGTAVLFQNADDMALFQERGIVRREQCTLVPGCGVDTERFRPAPSGTNGTPVVLLPARMLWSKGVGVLVEAGRILRSRQVSHRIVLAGCPDPANPDSIPEGQLQAWSHEGVADWVGFQDDMPGLVSGSDVVCLPSHYREGIPLALIEGASAGKALVTTDTPGCREIARDGINGRLVPPRDPARLAEALEGLLKDRGERERMGAESRAHAVARFSKERVIQTNFQVYRELLEGRWPA